MTEYHIGIDINARVYTKVEAKNLAEAVKKAKTGNYIMPDLNKYDYMEDYIINILDKNFNEVYKFDD